MARGGAWCAFVKIRCRVEVSSVLPFVIPRGERGTGSRHPFQLGTERPTAGVHMSSKTGRSCLLLTSSCRIAFGVGLRVDVSIFVEVRTSLVEVEALRVSLSGSARGRCPWWSAAGGVSVSFCQRGCGGVRPAAWFARGFYSVHLVSHGRRTGLLQARPNSSAAASRTRTLSGLGYSLPELCCAWF